MKSIILVGDSLPYDLKDAHYRDKRIVEHLNKLYNDNMELIKATFSSREYLLVDPFTNEMCGSLWHAGQLCSLENAIQNLKSGNPQMRFNPLDPRRS